MRDNPDAGVGQDTVSRRQSNKIFTIDISRRFANFCFLLNDAAESLQPGAAGCVREFRRDADQASAFHCGHVVFACRRPGGTKRE